MKAFPTAADNGHSENQDGMELRDYFAAKAMPLSYQFWMHDYYEFGFSDGDEARGLSSNRTLIAETAYQMADAMMEARK
jgi:hypothetical protein